MLFRHIFSKRFYRTNPMTLQWNKTIRSHQMTGNYQQALKLFQIGIEKNTFQPNAATYLTMLDICKELKSLSTVRNLHQLIDQSTKIHPDEDEICHNPRIRSSLMDVYIKCDDLDGAYRVFQSMKDRNIIDYGAIMAAFNQHDQYEKTIQLAKEMSASALFSSPILCTLLVQACAELKRYDDGCHIHQRAKNLLGKDKVFLNEMMNFYLKFHDENQAYELFQQYPNQHTLVDYSLFMKYYNRQYQPEKTFEFYHRLKKNSHLSVDHIIYVLLLQAVANGCCLQMSEQIHDDVKKFGNNLDINNALINMYGKLGDLDRAVKIFNSMPKHNIVSYNILLNLYALYHQTDKAWQSYQQMCQQGHRPDEKTFVLLLHALSQTPTKIKESERIFSSIEPKRRGPMLTAAMIAALTRAQRFDQVKEMMKSLPKEKLLYYAIKANVDPSNDSFEYPITINHGDLAMYDHLISNIYHYAGLPDRLSTVDETLYNNNPLRSILSYSFYERTPGVIQYFKGTDKDLQSCQPTEQLALNDAVKSEEQLSSPILIGKNHRLCQECYEHFKNISRSRPKKKIFLRDSRRFYVFLDGACSLDLSF